jgi:hypothetical protein
VDRAFGVRKKGARLPIVEYAKQVSNAIEVERRAHQSLRYCRVRGERFRCSVSVATAAILHAAGGENSASEGREEWIEAQAQAVAKDWRGYSGVPAQMLPRVQELREEAKQRAAKEQETLAIGCAILLTILIAGVLALLFVPSSTLASWAQIALLVGAGIFALWWLLSRESR